MNYHVGERVHITDVAFAGGEEYEITGYDIDRGHKLYHLSPVKEDDTVNHNTSIRRVIGIRLSRV